MSYKAEVLLKKKTINFPHVLNKLKNTENFKSDPIGGILKNGQLGWVAYLANLDIVSIKNGNKVADYSFPCPLNATDALITCVTEIEIPDVNTLILAICIQYFPVGGMICLFSVCGSRILRCIDMLDKITCCYFVPDNVFKKSCIQMFDGCLIVGTNVGKVFFVDLCFKKCREALFESKCNKNELDLIPCHTVLANNLDQNKLKAMVKYVKKENFHLAIGLEVVQNSGSVLSLLLIPQQLTLVVGLIDGRMILYDLIDLQAYHLAYPPENHLPLMNLAFIEPADDPRATIYVWAFHSNEENSVAVMHSIMFENKKLINSEWIYNKFQSCCVRLTIPFIEKNCKPIACQGLTKNSPHEEEIITLCLLSWVNNEKKNNMLVFDLNQWYKEQMPDYLDTRTQSNCLVYFTLSQTTTVLDVWMDIKSVTPFYSVQRPEEHFYPNALSFECLLFTGHSCDSVYWPGLQNKVLDLLNTIGPKAVYEPENCYNAIMNAALIPWFWEEHTLNKNLTKNKKRELIMSIALEYNCVGLLKKCASLWSDGSHVGNECNSLIDGVSLSTLTDWIWLRATTLKDCCNTLCLPLFDHSDRQIDQRTKKQLSHCSRQLILLSDLLEYILTSCRTYIPIDVRETLEYQQNSIRMSFEYQEVLQWLVNIDLLPENTYNPYPYTLLNNFYRSQRYKFAQINKTTTNTKRTTSLSSRNLFIDAFIEHECNVKELKNQWKESNGLYPPISLQEMLRILLVPNIKIENKYILILYLFLDLSIALDEERHGNIIENLIKFPSVFNLNPSVIKRTQAFWKLDHGQFEAALEELFSPLSGNNNIIYWQHELLIETLLYQNAPSLALQALRAQTTPINSLLEIKILLANGFVSEAFDIQRLKGDIQLLREFYKICFNTDKWLFILKLALTESEGRILREYLNEIDTNSSEIFHIVYLLQRSKYMEAVDLINKLEKNKQQMNILSRTTGDNDGGGDYDDSAETSKLILSAYNLTMTPTVKTISNSYFTFCERSKNTKINNKPLPFSTKLIQNPIDLTNGIYQRAFDSIADCDQNFKNGSIENVPFVRKSIRDRDLLFRKKNNLIVPTLIGSGGGSGGINQTTGKRRLSISSYGSSGDNDDNEELPSLKRPHLDKKTFNFGRKPLRTTTLLTSFRDKKNKNNENLFGNNSTLNDSLRALDNKNVRDYGKNYLTQKLIENITNTDLTPQNNSTTPTTPQSILKQYVHDNINEQSHQSFMASTLRKLNSDEMRTIKFNINESNILPSSLSTTTTTTSAAYLGVKKRAAIRLSDASSVDEFFSPNNSKIDDDDFPENVDNINFKETCVTPTKLTRNDEIESNEEEAEKIISREEQRESSPEMTDENKMIESSSSSLTRKSIRNYTKSSPEKKHLATYERKTLRSYSISPEKNTLESNETQFKRRALRSSSKTPDRHLRDHRTKTPEKNLRVTISKTPERNLRARTKTPERNLRATSTKTPDRNVLARTKTPDIVLTPYRKSTRIMEKSNVSLGHETIHKVIIEEEEEEGEQEMEHQKTGDIILLDETLTDKHDRSSFMVTKKRSILTDETMLPTIHDESDLDETSCSDLDLSTIKSIQKKIIFDNVSESETEEELQFDNDESIESLKNDDDDDDDENDEDEGEELGDNTNYDKVEMKINDEDDDDDEVEVEEIDEDYEDGIVDEEQLEEDDDEGNENNDDEEDKDEEEDDEEDDDGDVELNKSLEIQSDVNDEDDGDDVDNDDNDEDDDEESHSSETSSSSSSKSELAKTVNTVSDEDVINILSSSEEETEKNSEDEFEKRSVKSIQNKGKHIRFESNDEDEEENDNDDIQLKIVEITHHNIPDLLNKQQILIPQQINEILPFDMLEQQNEIADDDNNPPVYHKMESSVMSSMLYDNIDDFDMETTEEPENLNNALIIDFNYNNNKETTNLNVNETIDLNKNKQTVEVEKNQQEEEEDIAMDTTDNLILHDPLNEAQIMSTINESTQPDTIINKTNESEINVDTSIIIEDQDIRSVDLLNVNIVDDHLIQDIVPLDEQQLIESASQITVDESKVKTDTNLLNKNITEEPSSMLENITNINEKLIESELDDGEHLIIEEDRDDDNYVEVNVKTNKDIAKDTKTTVKLNEKKNVKEKEIEKKIISPTKSSKTKEENIKLSKFSVVIEKMDKQKEMIESEKNIIPSRSKSSLGRQLRSRSASIENVELLRNKRGQSVPKVQIDSPIPAKRIKRTSIEITQMEATKIMLQLERIDENNTPTTSTPKRLTRRNSFVETPTQSTPQKRLTRDRDSNDREITEIMNVSKVDDITGSGIKNTLRSSSRLGASSSASNDEQTMRTPQRKNSRKSEDDASPSPVGGGSVGGGAEDSQPLDYSTSRRLTRNQLAVLEKMEKFKTTSASTIKTKGAHKKKSSPNKSLETIDSDDYESEQESNTSNISVSTSISTRSKTKKQRELDRMSDTSSVAGSVKSKRGRPRKLITPVPENIQENKLPAIQEDSEDDEKVTGETPRKRGRPRKNSTSSHISSTSVTK